MSALQSAAKALSHVRIPIIGKNGKSYTAVVNLGKSGTHDMSIMHEGKEVGSMAWNAVSEPGIPKGSVLMLDVDPLHQRQGLATNMWDIAKKVAKENKLATPVHSDFQTPEGMAWNAALKRLGK